MIFPLWVQGLSTKRWPYVTTAIVAINILVFVMTKPQMDEESRRMAKVEFPLLLIAAAHPEVEPPAQVKPLVDSFQKDNRQLFERIRSGKQPPMSTWESDMREWSPSHAASEMAKLAQELGQSDQDSLLEKYAFHPYKPSASFVTANFLHGGWMHLIFNMWFLWLAGTMMEDVWGPLVYTIFYLLAGVAGLIAHATTYPHSVLPVLGASGAIAGLIGAFLVRFPETKIDLVFIFFFFRIIRFSWAACFVLPLWLLVQIFWGTLIRESGGVAYWAHIGGFLFGMVMAIALRQMGVERMVVDPAEVGFSA
jgi:membrane associated rhomboid family serine protease